MKKGEKMKPINVAFGAALAAGSVLAYHAGIQNMNGLEDILDPIGRTLAVAGHYLTGSGREEALYALPGIGQAYGSYRAWKGLGEK